MNTQLSKTQLAALDKAMLDWFEKHGYYFELQLQPDGRRIDGDPRFLRSKLRDEWQRHTPTTQLPPQPAAEERASEHNPALVKFVWWSWFRKGERWVRSCWYGKTIEEAVAFRNPGSGAGELNAYKNRLVKEMTTFEVVADQEPGKEIIPRATLRPSPAEHAQILEWKSISVAPKDETVILGRLPDSDVPQSIVFRDGAWRVQWDESRLSKFDQPTHWISLKSL